LICKCRDLLVRLFVYWSDGYRKFGRYPQVQCADNFSKGTYLLILDSSENLRGIEKTGSVSDHNRTAGDSWSGKRKWKRQGNA
jgi:hypothetical protein